MNTADPERALQYIRRLVGEKDDPPPDGALLRRYLVARDQEAFAALVRRHGPMVFGVCRSVLRDRHDAEDAFQAAFLILARQGGSIRVREGVAGWIQRVAYRVALRASANKARRQAHEARAAHPAEVASCDDLPWRELRAVLHEELGAMPGRFRTPLVLCYLEGLTQEEAAQRLGCTAATVKGCLQRGRERLRLRLERRGVALTSALGAVLTGQALAEPTARHFTLETATAAATALAHDVSRPAATAKLAALSAALLSAGLLVGGMAVLPARPITADPPAVPANRPAVDAHGDPLPQGAVARLGTLRFNHGEGARHLFFSPDGKTVLSEGGGKLRLWDAATGEERGRLATHRDGLECLVLTPDAKTLVSLNEERVGVNDVVRAWDLGRMGLVRTLALPVRRLEQSTYRRNAVSPDGALGAVNLPQEMRVFDLTTGRELHKLAKGGKEVRDVAFAGGDLLVTADMKNVIDVWDARTGRPVRQFAHGAPVGFLAASDDGRWLATLEHHTSAIDRMLEKDVVRVWDLSTGTMAHTLAARPKRWFMGVRFSPDGKRLLTTSYGTDGRELTVWDVATGKRLREIPDAFSRVFAVSKDGKRLAVGWSMVEVWDLDTGRRVSGEDGSAWALALAYSPKSDRIVLLGESTLGTWEAATGRRVDTFTPPRDAFVPALRRLSPDGRLALSFPSDWGKCQGAVWDVAGRRRLYDVKAPTAAGAFSHDSSLLATWEATSKEVVIRLREARTGKEVRSFPAGLLALPFLAFTSADKTLFAVGKDITGYDVATGKALFSWRMRPVPDNSGGDVAVGGRIADPDERHPWRGIAVSPDGSRIAVTLAGGFGLQPLKHRVALFDARTGRLLRRWSDSDKPSNSFDQLCFSPDGQLLATSDGSAIHVWETATSKLIRTFRGHRGDVSFLAFSPDARRLSSASQDSTVLVWDVTGQAAGLAADAEAEEAWKALGGDDAGRAQRAVWTLARTPAKSVPLLRARLRPVKPVGREQLERLIQDLDSDQFAVREKATAGLLEFGDVAEPAIRQALNGKVTLEQRRRMGPLLSRLEAATPSGEMLRSLRAVRVLEHSGAPEARLLLRELADGAEGARLTSESRAALTRLSRRSP